VHLFNYNPYSIVNERWIAKIGNAREKDARALLILAIRLRNWWS